MVAANERILNRKPGGFASRGGRFLCRSVISADDRPVDCATSLCHDDRQSKFSLRSPPLPRGSKNFVSSWLCGEKGVSGTQPLVHNLYQGMTLDSVTGLYYERYRNYSPSLGTWISQDPLQYINGANTYQFVMSDPVGRVDPWGLDVVYNGMELGSTTPNPPPPSQTWNDAGPFSMASEWLTGGGASIIINGTPFINNAKSSPALQAEIVQFKKQLRNKIRAAAKSLQCGTSTTVTNSDPHFTYTMPGSRWAGFGEIHVNINATITVNKDRTSHVTYSVNINFNGYDRYQWGTAMNSGHWYFSIPGEIINQTGTPFNSFWSWTEPFNGSE